MKQVENKKIVSLHTECIMVWYHWWEREKEAAIILEILPNYYCQTTLKRKCEDIRTNWGYTGHESSVFEAKARSCVICLKKNQERSFESRTLQTEV